MGIEGRLGTEPWYDFLNLGYKILPDAGSDFPYMDLPGVVRNYVKIDGPFSTDAWFEGFRRGNMYVTNGPSPRSSPHSVRGSTNSCKRRLTPGGIWSRGKRFRSCNRSRRGSGTPSSHE